MRTQSYEIRIQEGFHAARHTGYQHTLTVSVHRLPTYVVSSNTQATAKLNHPTTLRVSVHRLPTTLNSPIGYLYTDTLKIEQSDYFDDIAIYSEYLVLVVLSTLGAPTFVK